MMSPCSFFNAATFLAGDFFAIFGVTFLAAFVGYFLPSFFGDFGFLVLLGFIAALGLGADLGLCASLKDPDAPVPLVFLNNSESTPDLSASLT